MGLDIVGFLIIIDNFLSFSGVVWIMHAFQVRGEVVPPWPDLVRACTAINLAAPKLVTEVEDTMDTFPVSFKVIGSVEALTIGFWTVHTPELLALSSFLGPRHWPWS